MISFTAMSSWLFAALALGLAGVLAVLQYLRIRPRRVRVITTLFWQQASEQIRARSLFERFRHIRTYLLLLVAALLMLLALAKPVFDADDCPYRVIVLEAGIAMTSEDDRFDKALELVRNEVADSREERVAVIVADPEPRVLKHFDDNLAALEGRLDDLKASDVPANRRSALRTAKSVVSDRPGAEVVLVSAQPTKLDDSTIRVLAAGKVCENAFVLSATFVPDSDDQTKGVFHWRVGYTGRQQGKVTVSLKRKEETLFNEALQLKPGDVKVFSVSDIAANGSVLAASVSGDDAIKEDSRIEYRVPNRRLIRIVPVGTAPLPEALVSMAKGLPEVSTAAAEVADEPVIQVGPMGTDARILIQPSKAKGELQAVSVARHPLTKGLVFEDALCHAPATPLPIGENNVPLLLAGRSPIAVLDTQNNRIVVADTLFEKSASIIRRTGYVVFWNKVLRQLAKWDDAPLVLSPILARQAEFANADTISLKAEMASIELMEGVAAEVPSGSVFWAPLWQLILGCALILLILEAALNIKRKIA